MRENENIAHNFLNSEKDLFCVISTNGKFFYANDALYRVANFDKSQFESKTFFDIVSPQDVTQVKEVVEHLAPGGMGSFETRFVCKEEEQWISWHVFRQESDIYAIGHDVTNVHADKETLQIAQNRLRLLHQATSNPMQTLGEKIDRVLNLGNLQLGMETAVVSHIKGENFVVVRSKTDDPLFVKDKEHVLMKTFDSIVMSAGNLIGIQDVKNSVYFEHPAHISTKYESYIAVPLYIDGEISGVLSFASKKPTKKDFKVTDYDFVRLMGQWVSSSLALLLANEQIAYTAAIVGSSEDAIIGQDPKGIITTWNKGAEKLLQYTAGEIIGKHFSVTIPVDGEDETENILNKLLKGEPLDHYDALRKKKDGTLVDVSVTISPILDEENNSIGASSVLRDITREKQIDKAKTEFVSLASHQLRTPLSAINWYAELLRDGEAGKMNTQQKEFVDEIFEGNQRMIRLVNELLNVSRIDFGNFSIDPVEIDIIEISKSVVHELAPQIQKKALMVEEEYKEKEIMYVADPSIFRIIIQNLVSNAVKYTPPKGKIKVSIYKREETKHLVIEISDTGCGIPKNQHSQVFSKLFRADNVAEMNTAGTGLGLYVLKAVVEGAGGAVSFESIEEEGTIFTVLLPLSGMLRKDGGKGLSQITP